MRLTAGRALIAVLVAGVSPLAAQARNAATASQAVEEYIRAASDSNLTLMTSRFGTDKGSAARVGLPGGSVDKRMLITQMMLAGVKVRALAELRSGKENERVVSTEIARGGCKVTLPVTAVRNERDGWLVRNLDLEAATEVNKPCTGSPGNSDR